jgi:glycerol transport system ATP-binding protein
MGIKVENITKSFEGKKVLDHISFEIKDGDFVSFLAPTGEGKTTLLRILAGVEKPDSGRVYYDDRDVTALSVQKRKISMVYQWFVNYPSMTVFENIAAPLKAMKPKPSKEEINSRVQETAALLKINTLMEHYPSELSGGQQQRLAIARALVKKSDYIFLDEPLTNLDYKLQEELRVELKNIFTQKARGAVVFATPQPVEALVLSSQVGFLHRGRMMQFGPVEQVYHRPDFLEVGSYFSHPTMNLFECQKVSENGHLWLKATDQLKLKVDQFREKLENTHYIVGIRAHALGFEKQTDHMIPVRGTVELGEVVGSDTELHLNHQGFPLTALIEGMGSFQLGHEITLYLHPERFFIFDRNNHQLVARTHSD